MFYVTAFPNIQHFTVCNFRVRLHQHHFQSFYKFRMNKIIWINK